MGKEETLQKNDHYRCRLCGQLSPISASRCVNASCGAQLSLYGEILAGEEEAYTPPVEKRYCPNCGRELAAGEVTCACTQKAGGFSVGDTYDQTEKKEKRTRKAWKTEPKEKPNRPKLGKGLAVLMTIVSVAVVIVMAIALVEANHEADRYQSKYYDMRQDYNSLSDDYDDLKDAYDAWQTFISNNGLDSLHNVRVTGVYNVDSEGKKINDDVTSSKMDRLCIGVDITAADVKNRWAEPLQITLFKSGEKITEWTIDPGKQYGDEKETVGWKMWTLSTPYPGTYVAEFRHKGFVILRHEIVVK